MYNIFALQIEITKTWTWQSSEARLAIYTSHVWTVWISSMYAQVVVLYEGKRTVPAAVPTHPHVLLLSAWLFPLQVSRQSHTCAHSRSLTLAAAARQQLGYEEAVRPGTCKAFTQQSDSPSWLFDIQWHLISNLCMGSTITGILCPQEAGSWQLPLAVRPFTSSSATVGPPPSLTASSGNIASATGAALTSTLPYTQTFSQRCTQRSYRWEHVLCNTQICVTYVFLYFCSSFVHCVTLSLYIFLSCCRQTCWESWLTGVMGTSANFLASGCMTRHTTSTSASAEGASHSCVSTTFE